MTRRRVARVPSVLLVEDDGAVRRVIRDMLTWCGCRVQEAADAGQALDALTRSEPDAILLDAVLPGINGLELLDKIAASGLAADVPVIATTGGPLPDDTFRTRGVRAVLRKPFSLSDLRRALAPFLWTGAARPRSRGYAAVRPVFRRPGPAISR